MRIQLRVRNARIGELEKELSELRESLGLPREQGNGVNSDIAFLNDTVATLTAAVAERDARIAALKSKQVADIETPAVRKNGLARTMAEGEAQRKNLGELETALAAANARIAEEEAAGRAALELRNSMAVAIEKQQQRIARLESELAVAVRDRDAKETLAAREKDLAHATAKAEAQRKSLGALQATLAAANTRLAEEEAAGRAALELRKSMETAIEDQQRRIAQLEADLATAAREREASETLTARHNDLARAAAKAEAQRKSLGALQEALAAANSRLAEEEAAGRAALERRKSMEAAAEDQRQRITRLETDLAAAVRDRDAIAAAAATMQSDSAEQAARLATANARVSELEAEAPAHAHTGAALALKRGRAYISDLDSAEDSAHHFETKDHANGSPLDDGPTHDARRGTNGTGEVAFEAVAPLFIRTGESEVVHVLGPRTTIGRTRENDLQIDAKYISRHHAVILAGPTQTVIEDLNSTNGVTVNGRRIMRQTLKDGDIVLIGAEPFRYAERPVGERH